MSNTRRVLLVEVVMPKGRWSATSMQSYLRERIPEMAPIVYGEADVGSIDATRKKLNQLNREIEQECSYADLTHSGHKALSFFRDCWPDKFWKARVTKTDEP